MLQIAQIVELLAVPRLNKPAVAPGQRRFLPQRAQKLLGEVILGLDFTGQRDKLARRGAFQRLTEEGKFQERHRHRGQLPRSHSALNHAGHDPGQVVDASQMLSDAVAKGRLIKEILHGVQTSANRLNIAEGIDDPLGQKTAPHRGNTLIEDRQKRTGAASIGGLENLQTSDRRLIDLETLSRMILADGIEVIEGALLRFTQVVQRGPGGLQRQGVGLRIEAEAGQRFDPQLPQ